MELVAPATGRIADGFALACHLLASTLRRCPGRSLMLLIDAGIKEIVRVGVNSAQHHLDLPHR
jgi:hypothetical protein